MSEPALSAMSGPWSKGKAAVQRPALPHARERSEWAVGWKRWLCGNVQATCVQTLSTQEYASAVTRLLAPGQSLPAGSLRANRDELTAAYLAANNCARRIRLRRRTNKEVGFSQPQRGKGFTLAFWYSRTIARTSVDRSSWRDIISSGFHKRRRFITCLMPYNVELTGAARLYRAASRERSERG